MFTINKSIFCVFVFTATLGVGMARAQSEDDRGMPNASESTPLSNYCHQRFPAIDPKTLGTTHPQLEVPSTGDMVDYYGPCDHDPLSKDEVERQEHDQLIGGLRNFGGM